MSGMGIGVDGTRYEMESGTMAFLGLNEDDLGEIMGRVIGAVRKIAEE